MLLDECRTEFVELAGGHEYRHLDRGQDAHGAVPLQCADDHRFVLALKIPILVHADHREHRVEVGLYRTPEDVFGIELLGGGLIGGSLEILVRVVLGERFLRRRRESRHPLVDLFFGGVDVERFAAEKDAGDVIWMDLVVLDGDDRAPRVSVEKHLVVFERAAKRIEFVDVARDHHQRGVGHTIRLPCPELVVAHHRAVDAQAFHRLEIEAAHARAAVNKDHRRARPGAAHLIPNLAAGYRKHRLTRTECRGGRRGGSGGGRGGRRRVGRGALGIAAGAEYGEREAAADRVVVGHAQRVQRSGVMRQRA